MIEKRGTTPNWKRPIHAIFKLHGEIAVVDLVDVLVETHMVQSKAEARRLIKQGRVWDIDEESPRKLTDRRYTASDGGRLVVGEPKFVNWKGGQAQVLDVTKGVVIKFVLAAGV